MSKFKNASSFRDTSGFVYVLDDILYRQINKCAANDFERFIQSGLYQFLLEKSYIIEHSETSNSYAFNDEAFKVLKPSIIDFISYPYEWSFSMLKDAALLTLCIQKHALNYGMSLKDATAYNIQFYKGKPIFIDTLSFESFQNTPWKAYGQFCRHFLSPLILASYADIRLIGLLKNYIDGIPLDFVSKILPIKTRFNLNILAHIHLHSKSIKSNESNPRNIKTLKMNKEMHLKLITALESFINGLKWKPENTEWGDYYTFTNYTNESFEKKKAIVSRFMNKINPKNLWDIGANNGLFSRIASDLGIETIAFDIDPIAIEKSYLKVKRDNEQHILPLICDLTNPIPPIGWANEERKGFMQRGKADCVMALALIHHLAISNNLPFEKIAGFLSKISNYLIIEFVPKEDSKVQTLLATREDIFDKYDINNFKREFENCFEIIEESLIDNSKRTLFLLKNRN